MRFAILILAICLLQLAGCNARSSTPDNVKPANKDSSVTKIETTAKAESDSDASKKKIEPEWLALPDDFN